MILARNIKPNGSANLISLSITDFDLENERIKCCDSALIEVWELDFFDDEMTKLINFFKKCKEKESRPRNVYGNGWNKMLKISTLSQISDIIPQDEFENLDHSMINHSIVSTFKSFDMRKITYYGNNNFFIRTESWDSIDEPYTEQVKEIIDFMKYNNFST